MTSRECRRAPAADANSDLGRLPRTDVAFKATKGGEVHLAALFRLPIPGLREPEEVGKDMGQARQLT